MSITFADFENAGRKLGWENEETSSSKGMQAMLLSGIHNKKYAGIWVRGVNNQVLMVEINGPANLKAALPLLKSLGFEEHKGLKDVFKHRTMFARPQDHGTIAAKVKKAF